jgi:hypothetical protein
MAAVSIRAALCAHNSSGNGVRNQLRTNNQKRPHFKKKARTHAHTPCWLGVRYGPLDERDVADRIPTEPKESALEKVTAADDEPRGTQQPNQSARQQGSNERTDRQSKQRRNKTCKKINKQTSEKTHKQISK